MPSTNRNNEFRYYVHDGPHAFSFEPAGRLSDHAARELGQARHTAHSTLGGRSQIVDVSYVTHVDAAADAMLRRRHRGAQLVANLPQGRIIVESITGQGPEIIPAAPQHHTWFPFKAALWALLSIIFLTPGPVLAADLKAETVQAWQDYVEGVNARNQKHLVPGNSFLSIDEVPGQAARLRGGEILVSPAGAHVPMKVSSGMIHDWMGAAFIPNVTLPDVLSVVRDYGRYQDVYRPNVLDAKPLVSSQGEDRFSLLLMNKSAIAKTALDSDYRSLYIRVDDHRRYSITEATRIQEVADYDTPSQHTLPENEGKGLIWRLYSVARFEERDGGVYVEVEAVALSRDIPFSLRWLVDPIVRRISRSSLLTSLKQTGDAARSGISPSASRISDRPLCQAGTSCVGASAFRPVR